MKNKAKTKALLFIICLGSSLVPFISSALNLALPYINKDLSLDAIASGWVATSYMLSTAIFQIPFARIADMAGRKKVFMGGVMIVSVFSILSGLATTGAALIAYRFLAGIGSAMMFGTNTAILTSSIPAHKRGKAMGILTAAVYFSLAAGPFIGGMLTQYYDWHSIFFVSAFISLAVLAGGHFIIREDWKEEVKTEFDFSGSTLFAVGLSALIYGFTVLPHVMGFIFTGVGIVVLLFFAYYEKMVIYPVFNIHIFLQNKVFSMSSLSALINYAATFAISFMLSLYLQYVRGLSPRDAGLILVIQSVVQAVASLKSGSLSDKRPPAFLATLGMGIIAVGLVGLCFITENTSYYFIGGMMILLGLGFGIFSSPNTNIIMSSVEKKHYGLASATMGTMRLTGQSLSMGIAIMAISVMIGDINLSLAPHPQFIGSMRVTFIIFFLLCIFGAYASFVRGKR